MNSIKKKFESEEFYQYQNYTQNESLWKPSLSSHHFNKFSQTISTSAEKAIYSKPIKPFFEQIKFMNNQFSSFKSGFFSQTDLTPKVFKQIADLINASVSKIILKSEIDIESHNCWLLNQLGFHFKAFKSHHQTITTYDKNFGSQAWQALLQLLNKPSTSQNPSELGVQQLADCFCKSPRTARPTRPAKFARKTQQKIKTT